MNPRLQGTPQSLIAALLHAFPKQPTCHVVRDAYPVMRDFLAQRFGAAILKAEAEGRDDEAQRLKELFDLITSC